MRPLSKDDWHLIKAEARRLRLDPESVFPFPVASPIANSRPTPYLVFDQVKGVSSPGSFSETYNFGTAHDTRVIIVGISQRSSINTPVSTVTIAGVSATSVASAVTSDNTRRTYLYRAAVTTETSGTVALTYLNWPDDLAVAGWYGYPVSATPADSGGAALSTTNSTASVALDVSPNGFMLAISASNSAPTIGWAGADTEVTSTGTQGTLNWGRLNVATITETGTFNASVNTTGNRKAIAAASWL